ncbi:MAG: sirohydrochlorin cobaltochelatase [Prevotella sp.]|nr:sirohydrochlorin cobaltochelatase [Prevotella sp.]
MNKIKYLMVAMLAIMMGMNLTSCSDDDDDAKSNYEKYQQAVNDKVNQNKKHDNVILLVAFGSTWQQAFDTFDKIEAEYKAEFGSEWDVFLAFSSAICINQAAAGENVEDEDYPAEVRNYYDPEHWLTAIGKAGYKQIVVQSLQVIPGEEYRRVRDSYVKDFMNNRNNDFTEEYMHSIDGRVAVGTPLMAEREDVTKLANALLNESDVKAALQNDGIVAFMGHGNPEGYDYYGANARYTELEEDFQALGKRCFVGTVDMEDNFVDDVVARIKEAGISGGKVQLYPLMSIAGDHAHNDMADPDDDESWFSVFNAEDGFSATAYETNYPKNEACYTKYKAGDEYIPALGERSAVRKLWMAHTREAIAAVKAGKGMSTPTTAVED